VTLKFLRWYFILTKSQYERSISTLIVNQQLKRHKVECIMVSLDIIFLNTCYWIRLFLLKSKDNIMNPITKGFTRELVYSSSKITSLKPLKIKECHDDNHT
jgi:hypothetical protein